MVKRNILHYTAASAHGFQTDPQVVLKVALDRVEEFPILRGSGPHGKSQLTYQNYRNWTRRIREYRSRSGNGGGDADLLALATNYRRGSIYETEDHLPPYGDRQFWEDFNTAYLSQNKFEVTTAREIAVFALRKRSSTAVVPSISQVRNYVRHLPLGRGIQLQIPGKLHLRAVQVARPIALNVPDRLFEPDCQRVAGMADHLLRDGSGMDSSGIRQFFGMEHRIPAV